MNKIAVIFGGTGFIGLHFSKFLLTKTDISHVILADIKPPEQHAASAFIRNNLNSGDITYIECDVRQPVDRNLIDKDGTVTLIANFAAVHREPGHESHEYYETNIPGARNVCQFAEDIGCKDIIFTSSISPYGPTERPKDEGTIPTPETAYGGSKLAAELIHTAWRDRHQAERRLLIVRPGVVFGPGEGGNVSRLVRTLSKGFFVYAGNENTRKAGIYVEELCNAIWWLHERREKTSPTVTLANMTMNPGPSMKEYVEAVKSVSGKKAWVPSIPVWSLLLLARIIETLAAIFRINTSINVVRIRKLVRSNNIVPNTLTSEGYNYLFTLESAMADWRTQMPSEWGPIPHSLVPNNQVS